MNRQTLEDVTHNTSTAAVSEGVQLSPAESHTPDRKHSRLIAERFFSKEGTHPYDELEWEKRSAVIANEKGEKVFEQTGVEVPKSWSQMASNVVVSKYFRGRVGTPEREYSVRQLIDRVSDTITGWGFEGRYFTGLDEARVFSEELTYLLVNQFVSFNSPVWFNCGFERKPQCSACFINSVQDTMDSILSLAKTEGMLFKYGSGTGTNFSALRSSREPLAGGGIASGPVSFMKGFDAFAGVIKSGGRTRRAAKMVILDIDHPDIVDFIMCKANEERKAWALIDAGYDGTLNGEAYRSVFFQNSNNSVRVMDEFMEAAEKGEKWHTRSRLGIEPCETHDALELLRMIADSAHVCGDPGMQFDTTINRWHTCPTTARINASNPCSEYMFLDDSACNLASLNLMKFLRDDGRFAADAFRRACEITILAQEILVDFAGYPTPAIEKNSHDYRPLGLGYANLGALLMALGIPYDSDKGRAYAACVTALMTGSAYAMSARVASHLGPFSGFEKNREPMLRVMGMHREAVLQVDRQMVASDLYEAALDSWDRTIDLGGRFGFRNAQATVLAPTGTIGFMMDCDTTGVEPDIALVKYKKLVGGGVLKIVNQTVSQALRRLGYGDETIQKMIEYLHEQETIEGAPGLSDEHLPVFDCAFRPLNGIRSIHYMGHLRMMSAVQPFLSGAISKTVNMPADATIEEIEKTFMTSWRMGLKAVAIYRDGCKRTQPLSTTRLEETGAPAAKGISAAKEERKPLRHKLPNDRLALTHKFEIGGNEGYITVGLYEDGEPGEIFIRMHKEGSTVSGLMDCFATAVSIGLQYGVPLKVLVNKFNHTRFEPSGFTKNPELPMAKSVMDYIFRWLASKFLTDEDKESVGIVKREEIVGAAPSPLQRLLAAQNAILTDLPDESAQAARGESGNGHGSKGQGNGGREAKGMKQAAVAVAAKASASGETRTMRQFTFANHEDAPPCPECGALLVRNGSCYKCIDCGASSGCA
ncbi:MAG: vitamin B12-dependent ribonucleotide reductase [bacterium]